MSYLIPEKKSPKRKPKTLGTTIVRETTNMSPSLMIASNLAYKYAGTKKRWFDGKKKWDKSKDEYGLTLDPEVTHEPDFVQFRNLVKKLRTHYHYDLF